MDEPKRNNILSQSEIDFFQINGFLLIKNVYHIEDLKVARNLFEEAFKSEIWRDSIYNSENIINDIYRIQPKLLDIIVNEEYINILKSILGDNLIWLPECAVHYNRFTDWHCDTTEQEISGIISHKNQNENLIQCATYFQANTSIGGGLTVIPGTHLMPDRFHNLYKKDIFNRVINKAKKIFKVSLFDKLDRNKDSIQIESEFGDLLIFDVRLYHKSTGNKFKSASISKFAVFNTFGNDNVFTREYLEFMKRRREPYYQFMQTNPMPEILHKKANSFKIKIWE